MTCIPAHVRTYARLLGCLLGRLVAWMLGRLVAAPPCRASRRDENGKLTTFDFGSREFGKHGMKTLSCGKTNRIWEGQEKGECYLPIAYNRAGLEREVALRTDKEPT